MKRVLIFGLAWMFFQVGYSQNLVLQSTSFSVDTNQYLSSKDIALYQEKTYFFVRVAHSGDRIRAEIALTDSTYEGRLALEENEALVFSDSVQKNPKGYVFYFSLKEGMAAYKGVITLIGTAGQKILVPIFVYTHTRVTRATEQYEIFQEEELVIDMPGHNIWNIQTDPDWKTNDEFDYKISKELNSLKILVRPHLLGHRQLTIPLRTIHPILQRDRTVGNSLGNLELRLNVKPNQIDFLSFDKEEIFYDKMSFQNGEEIPMRNNSNLILRKTYRVEDKQEPGGNLIAEVFTRTVLANGKVLCWIRPFSLHRVSEGYLYLKDGDRTRFITNLNILEKPRVDAVQILRKNEDWSDKLYVRPGEDVEIKVLGSGLLKSKLWLEGLQDIRKDSVSLSDEVAFFKLKVPRDFSRKKTTLFMNNKVTAFDILLREYQEPRQLDFVQLKYGDESAPLNDDRFDKPILYGKLLKDVTLVFDPNKIDQGSFYGKQYLQIDVKVVSPRGEVKETLHKEIVVCPGNSSIRYGTYDRSDCENSVVNLNDLLNLKTYNMEGYSQIFINIKHTPKNYSSSGYSRSIKIILKREVVFDLQISFPAGLLVKRFDVDGIGSLYGISIAAIAQFSFYDNLQIGKVKPYRIGAGFLALNAFNFSSAQDVNRDVAVVAIGSVYPINRGSKFSFPLHTGIGYLLKGGAWFLLFGPGIDVRF